MSNQAEEMPAVNDVKPFEDGLSKIDVNAAYGQDPKPVISQKLIVKYTTIATLLFLIAMTMNDIFTAWLVHFFK